MAPLFLALSGCLVAVANTQSTDIWRAVTTGRDFYLYKRSYAKLNASCSYVSVNQTNETIHSYQLKSGYKLPNGTWMGPMYFWGTVINGTSGYWNRVINSGTPGNTTGQQSDLLYTDGETCTILKAYNASNPSQELGCEMWVKVQNATNPSQECSSTYTSNCTEAVENNYDTTCPTSLSEIPATQV
uniref:Lipocalin n=1 Tax=Argas monolakensis TaxID=34602 RepID=Q09JU8_ARGMO|nr:lipocalin [Argas monolakensis]